VRCCALSAALAALASLSVGAAAAGNPWFPATRGSTWTQSVRFTGTINGRAVDQTMDITATVTSAVRKGHRTVVVMTMKSGETTTGVDTYIVSPGEVLRVSTGPGGSKRFRPPVPLARFPLRAGRSWTWRGTMTGEDGRDHRATAAMRVSPIETVRTPAGAFRAHRVEVGLRFSQGGLDVRMPAAIWYARNVGMVKTDVSFRAPDGSNFKIVGVLKSYRIR